MKTNLEHDNILYSDDLIDLNNFEKQEKINEIHQKWCYYKIMNIVNGKKSIAKVYRKKLENFPRHIKIAFHQEVDINSRLNHSSILKFQGYSLTNIKNKPRPTVILEYSANDSLYEHFFKYETKFNDTQKLIIIYGIACGMSYLHSHDLIHCDLIPEYIFLDEFFYPKITGFHYTKKVNQNDSIKDIKIKEPLIYLAPEVLSKLEYSKSSDVYSFAIIMYQLLDSAKEHNTSFKESFINDVTKHGHRPYFRNSIKEAYIDLTERCWSQDPKLRPTFDEIVQELRTNKEFVTDEIDKEEYYKYIKMIEDSTITFNTSYRKRKLDEILNSKPQIFYEKDVYMKSRGTNYSDNQDFDLTEYKLKYREEETNDTFIICELLNKTNTEKYCVQIYKKEINNFYKYELNNFYRKLNIISQINHPAILNFIGYSPVNLINENTPIIITEYYPRDISDLIYNMGFMIDCSNYDDELINDTKRLIIIYGIASAMSYLHSHDIIHRDLKASNVCLDEHYLPKIFGFDLSKEIKNKNGEKSKRIKGTAAYLAPEIFTDIEYSKSSDVYAFAFILYEIFTIKKVFNELETPVDIKIAVSDHQQRPKFTVPIKDAYRNLIERCWSQDPKLRPTFEEIVEELRTNKDFVTDEIDKEEYYEYIKLLDEIPNTFDPSKRIKKYDEMIKQIHTFKEIDSYINTATKYETEKFNISIEYEYFDLNSYEIEYGKFVERGLFYDVEVIRKKTSICDSNDKYFIKKELTKNIKDLSLNEVTNYLRELKIIVRLNHPSILKFIGYTITYFPKKTPSIIIEYCSQNSLLKYIKLSEILDETHKLIILYGIASAMSYLHLHDILHRDLKAANIFLDDSYYPKLGGFNISKEVDDDDSDGDNHKIIGTPAYLAPEILLRKQYSKSSDVYSFAFIIYELIIEKFPFNECISPLQLKKKVAEQGYRPSFENPIKEVYKNLIERCWSQDSKLRPTFDEIVQELRTNKEFVTDEIDKEEYYKYIKMIEESQNSYEINKHLSHIDCFIKSQKCNFKEADYKINFRNIYETEFNNISFECGFINIEEFENREFIHKSRDFTAYKITNKTNKVTLFARKHKFHINLLHKDDIKYINDILLLNSHPSIVHYKGYSPVDFKKKSRIMILTEFVSNGTLKKILKMEMKNHSKSLLNDTKRLICIYGIASGMAYLHSHNIIHNKLKPSKIIIDDFLFPKIDIFYHTKHIKSKKKNSFIDIDQSTNGYDDYGDDIYSPPEYHRKYIESPAGNVYSFAMIAYQLIANEMPFQEVTSDIIKEVVDDKLRPQFKDSFPECYRKLIKKCWSDNSKERPTFDEIVFHLKTNPEFIDERINKEEFKSYIDFIDKSISSPNNIQINDFIKQSNSTFRKVQIDFNEIRNPIKMNLAANVGSIDLFNFTKLKKIGSGQYGNVYKIQAKDTEKLYAAKISKFGIDVCDEKKIINLSREINIISQIKHQSILQYIGFNQRNFKNKPKPVIILEFAKNGSLDQILDSERKGFSNQQWDDTKKLINIYGIAAGMAYLHKQDIIHRDLKPANILLDEYLFPKISDFGMSKFISEKEKEKVKYSKIKIKTSGFKGTYAYSAPEVIKNSIYSKAGDVYAFGMIVYEIMTNEIPFDGLNFYQFISKIYNDYHPEFKYPIHYCYRKLIESCWRKDYLYRPDFDDIVKNLETNKNFITNTVNEDEYRNYISFINQQQQIMPDSSSAKPNNKFVKVTFDLNHDKTIEQKVESSNFYLDLSKYERQNNISKSDFCKLYKFQDKETKNIYFGQMSMMTINQIKKDELRKFEKEIKIIKELNHPSLLKLIGFSPFDFKKQLKPVIVTEYANNGSLENILELERANNKIPGWNETKKLINIFGIASGMAYLHSKNIIHKSLSTSTIYLDDILAPKIGDFGLSTRFSFSSSITHESISGIKATPIYASPEVLTSNEYSQSSDVYSFSFIVYELVTNEIPFEEIIDKNQIFEEIVVNKNRPEIKEKVSNSYCNLIEKCWSQEPSERPTFDEIVSMLKNDQGFITDKINKEDYHTYIDFIEHQIETTIKIEEKVELSNEKIKEEEETFRIISVGENNVENLEFLSKKSINENDAENIYKYLCMLIEKGKYTIPLEYSVKLYKSKQFHQSFNYFTLLSKMNNPIALYFIGRMKFYGEGCIKNEEESYKILKHLSDNGIDQATEFLENNFLIKSG